MYLSLIRPNPQPLPYQGRGVNQSLSPYRREVYQRGRFVVYLPENSCKQNLTQSQTPILSDGFAPI